MVVHGVDLHGVYRVGEQGVEASYHRVAVEHGKGWRMSRSEAGRGLDPVVACAGVRLPLHGHTPRRDRVHGHCNADRRKISGIGSVICMCKKRYTCIFICHGVMSLLQKRT